MQCQAFPAHIAIKGKGNKFLTFMAVNISFKIHGQGLLKFQKQVGWLNKISSGWKKGFNVLQSSFPSSQLPKSRITQNKLCRLKYAEEKLCHLRNLHNSNKSTNSRFLGAQFGLLGLGKLFFSWGLFINWERDKVHNIRHHFAAFGLNNCNVLGTMQL